MLHEPHPALKLHALDKLNSLVHLFWPEISTSVPTIESLYEDEEFDQRQLAALVVSKDDALLAFQIAFDLVENEHQAFLLNLKSRLAGSKSQAIDHVNPDQGSSAPTSENGNATADNVVAASEDVHMTEESHAANGTSQDINQTDATYNERLAKIKGILSGETSIQLTLQFLYSHNR
ncbi:hypothetical protein B296_00031322 [Ensete ventricosum]|uniref:26S proteasome non-ATPase regulatory subunit 1/RPN2 N-terminal domain-containing protein n=1 Tax=Ensete ventricosum TaxID=4639 RepID=A0A427AGH4_ENSVE|nr:hypothetical protein B296_00031322 [Ensete ventricosum]